MKSKTNTILKVLRVIDLILAVEIELSEKMVLIRNHDDVFIILFFVLKVNLLENYKFNFRRSI